MKHPKSAEIDFVHDEPWQLVCLYRQDMPFRRVGVIARATVLQAAFLCAEALAGGELDEY